VAFFPFQSFVDSSHRGILERRAVRTEALCILLNLLLLLAAGSCSIQWTSESEINKQLQLLFTRTLSLKLSQWHHCHVKLAFF